MHIRSQSIAVALILATGLSPALADGQLPPPAPTQEKNSTGQVLTDAAIIATLISASIAAYRAGGPGPCACPEDTDRAGHRCGKRSAHTRAGGWTVYCYPSDITAEMIETYRRAHRPD